MSQYFVTNANSNVPHSYTISHNPHIQVFHMTDIINPPILIHYQDQVDSSFVNNPPSSFDISLLETSPEEMKQPIVFNVKHSWRIFGSSLDSQEGLWMFNLSGRKPLELAKHHNLGMTFKAGWIANVKVDIEDAITCINFITAHLSFIQGIPLPHYFNTNLLTSPLQSMEQVYKLHMLAVTAMGEFMAFINQWTILVRPNWASNFSSVGHSFIQRIPLTCLPMREKFLMWRAWFTDSSFSELSRMDVPPTY